MSNIISAEQEARDLLQRMGIEDAQSFSSGDLVELANLIALHPSRKELFSDNVIGVHFERIQKLEDEINRLNVLDRLTRLAESYQERNPDFGIYIYDEKGNLLVEFNQVGFIGKDE